MSDSNLVALAETAAYLIGLPKPIPEIIHEANLEATSLIAMYGYPAENHSITTIDGYILTHHRIPYGKNETVNNKTAIPVLIVHGMNSASLHAFDNGPVSLGLISFVLADNGYDVWLANLRSSSYSSHSTLTRQEQKFWDFSLSDMAVRDLAPLIDYALNKTGFSKISYVGQSMGTSVMFFLLAEKPEYNEKISGYIALGPALIPNYITAIIKILFIPQLLYVVRNQFNVHSLLTVSPLVQRLQLIFCPSDYPIICQIGMFINGGYSPNLPDVARIPVHTTHCSGGMSVKTLLHYGQMIQTQKFRKYDYGNIENLRQYGSAEPPELSIANIKVPTILMYGANDAVTTSLGVEIAKRTLPNVVEAILLQNPMATHSDYMFSKNGKEFLYDEIVVYLKRFLTNYYPLKN
uniref:Lipase n=1 Tax=Strigamia maritima TaxID=126957 RepID=T1ILR9_STRMM